MSLLLTLAEANGGGGVPDTPPTLITEVYGEDYGAGLPANFSPTFGPNMTKAGTPGFLSKAQLNNKGVIDINGSADYLTWDSPLTTEKLNLAIFSVAKQTESLTTCNILDFRAAGGSYKLILPAYAGGANNINGWYYGQASTTADVTAITGEDTREFFIRLWLFEDNAARLFLQGGTADKSGVFEDTALNETLRLGLTPSSTQDVEIAHIRIYSLPLGEKFTATSLDVIGREIELYYGNSEPVWNNLTV